MQDLRVRRETARSFGTDYREYPCYYPRPGWVEQTPDDILPALFESCRSAIAQSGVAKEDIAAIALSSQGAVTTMLDEDGKLNAVAVHRRPGRPRQRADRWDLQAH